LSYFNMLGLNKEPFSTSPDPDFFYLSKTHKTVLYKLRIAVKLKRGLCVVLGRVGAGKTTLARTLFQLLKAEGKENTLFHVMLNPISRSEKEFLLYLAELFKIDLPSPRPTAVECMKKIEEYLFQKGVRENKTVVLLIDEAQKLSPVCLETLRALLNYETNQSKLLQLILMGQVELLPRIRKLENFLDRISLKYMLQPLDKEETRAMMDFRLKKANYNNFSPALFKDDAIDEIHDYSKGYPRKITMLCHDALEALVMDSKEVVDRDLVCKLIAREVNFIGT